MHVVANLSRGHALCDVEEYLSNLPGCVMRLRPSPSQFEASSIGRNDGPVSRPLVDAIDAVHDHGRGFNLDADEIMRWRSVIKELELRFVPDEQIVDDFEGARAENFDNIALPDETAQ